MKKIMKLIFLFIITGATTFFNTVKAQDNTAELAAFTKNFEALYNKKDHKGLKELYTKDAVRIGLDGKKLVGNEAIRAMFEKTFKDNVTVEIHQDKVVTAADGSVTTTGTFHVTGTTAAGEKIDREGTYSNSIVKQNGKWKIAKNVLAKLAQ